MKPPYDITSEILKLIISISEHIGAVNARFLNKASPQLRKQNRIRTIQASLQIEGNTLTEEQITALMEHKRVIGPKKEVLEVQNAISVYENVSSFKSYTEKHFLKAHSDLMNGLMEHPGRYRTQGLGIAKGSNVTHVAPPAENVLF
jgi:Fic family protein